MDERQKDKDEGEIKTGRENDEVERHWEREMRERKRGMRETNERERETKERREREIRKRREKER